MSRSSALLAAVATVIAAVLLAHVPAAAQTSRSPAVVSTASGGAVQAADAARMPWGDPDLQGIWTNATITPFERPDALADKRFLTDDEAVALEARTERRRAEADRAPRDVRQLRSNLARLGNSGALDQANVARRGSDGRSRSRQAGGAGDTRLQPGTQHRLIRTHEGVGSVHHPRRAQARCFRLATTTPIRFCRRPGTW